MAITVEEVKVVQITLWLTDSQKMIIKANKDGKDPATGGKPNFLRTLNNEEDDDVVPLAKEILGKLLDSFPNKKPMTLSVDFDEPVLSNRGVQVVKEAAGLKHGELTDRAQSHLEVVGEAFPTLPAALQTSIKSMIAGFAAELAKLKSKLE